MYTLPKLPIPKTKTDTIAAFRGLNERASIADNEFADCCNISLKEYPAISVMDGYEPISKVNLDRDTQPEFDYQKITDLKAKNNMLIICDSRVWANSPYYCYFNGKDPILLGSLNISDFGTFGNSPAIIYEDNSLDEPHRYIAVYIEDKQGEISSEIYNIDDLLGYGNVTGMLTFGSRMILIDGSTIHISYFNNLDKWTVYNEDGVENEKCAKRIELLDDGHFTGCINYRDYPIFFKQNSMYILYGEYASAFTLSRIDMVGCPYPDTIAVCNGALYFLSKSGVMEYTGGTPKLISQELNIGKNQKSVYQQEHSGCADNRYYYIDDYVFNTYTRKWGKQRKTADDFYWIVPRGVYQERVYLYEKHLGELIVNDRAIKWTYSYAYRTGWDQKSDWSFTTKQFHEYQQGKKLLSRLTIGFENVSLTELKIEVSLDKGEFKEVYIWDESTDFVKEVPVILPPCDYFQIRVSGTGKAYIHYIKRRYRVLGG